MSVWHDEAKRLRDQGWKQAAIAEQCHVTDAAVSLVLSGRRGGPRKRNAVNAACLAAHKLFLVEREKKAKERRARALRLLELGLRNVDIAEHFRVTDCTVCVWLRRARQERSAAQ